MVRYAFAITHPTKFIQPSYLFAKAINLLRLQAIANR